MKFWTPDSYFSKLLHCFIGIYPLVTDETRADLHRETGGWREATDFTFMCQESLRLIRTRLKPGGVCAV